MMDIEKKISELEKRIDELERKIFSSSPGNVNQARSADTQNLIDQFISDNLER